MDKIVEILKGYLGHFQLTGPAICSFIIMGIMVILGAIVGIQAHFQDPTKPSKGLLFLAEWGIEHLTEWVRGMMGDGFDRFIPYFFVLVSYLFTAFIWSITGLPSVMDYMAIPLSLSSIMFVLIHATAIKYQRWGYFKRYVDPIAVFLPINLISMWSPLVSTCLRMFGNALSGWILITIVDWALTGLSSTIFSFMGGGLSGIWLAPIPTGVLNLYFSLFSGFIQTLVFASLTAVWIANERPAMESMGIETQALRHVESEKQTA